MGHPLVTVDCCKGVLVLLGVEVLDRGLVHHARVVGGVGDGVVDG
jgi:hypothetical protein